MADPLSTLANVGAVVGFVDVLARGGKALYEFCAAVKDAPKEIRALQDELQDIDGILLNVRDYCSQYQESSMSLGNSEDKMDIADDVLPALRGIQSEYTRLERAVNDTMRAGKPARKLARRVGWVMDQKLIYRSCQRLERFKSSLCIWLSTIGRRMDLVIQNEMRVLQESTSISRSQSKVLYNSVDRSLTSLALTTDTAFKELHDSVANSAGEQSRASRQLQRTAKKQETYNKSILRSNREMHEKLDSLMTKFNIEENTPENEPSGLGWVVRNGSLDQLALPLMLMKPKLEEALLEMMLPFGNQAMLSKYDVQMLGSELEELLAASHEASASAARRKRSRTAGTRKTGHRKSTNNSEIEHPNPLSGKKSGPVHDFQVNRYVSASQRTFRFLNQNTPTGNLCLRVEWGQNQFGRQRLAKTQVIFSPRPEIGSLGVLTSIAASLNDPSRFSIARNVSTYAVVDPSAPIFKCIESNDINGVRELLGSGRAAPTDRTVGNESVLSYAAALSRADLCELLLNEGADPENCRMDGANAIYSFRNGFWFGKDPQLDLGRSMEKILRDLVKAGCDFDAAAMGGSPLHFTPLPSTQTSRHIDEMQIAHLIRLLVQLGADLEHRNPDGKTPLLFNARMPGYYGLAILKQLIFCKADTSAVTRFSEGALHIAIAFSGQPSQDEEDDCLADRLLVLLQAGCEASQLDSGGHSPSDYALRDPNVWLQWCLAVEASGVTSMSEVLQAEDEAQFATAGKAEADIETSTSSDLEWESCSSDGESSEIIDDNLSEQTTEDEEYPHNLLCSTPSHLFLSFHGCWPWGCHPTCQDCGLRCPLDDVSRRKWDAWGMFQLLQREHDIPL